MNCCSSCIGDRRLQLEIFPSLGELNGTCTYCNTQNTLIVEVSKLLDHFEAIISAYTPDENGEVLASLLKKDWLMFPDKDIANSSVILSDIFDNGEITRTLFSPRLTAEDSDLLGWTSLRDELMVENRYFPNTNLNKEKLIILFPYITLKSNEFSERWYRARIQETDTPYSPDQMGAPPKEKASHGRANPVGIPYLYIASDISTAISEIRPHTGDNISSMEFNILDDLLLIDLRNPRLLVSPFILNDETDINLLRKGIDFLEHLGSELMKPVLPQRAAIDYIPSQYLCEFIKKCGYNGVIYKSSVGTGMNLALFNPENANQNGEITQHKVSRVSIETE